ncbi:hypothetical protein [Planomonospora sp. ID82291]|uniref:hypothetical protein n=1 Tax=Planomonospora sp. ID82291 TaxID=2738136 RepID=UPI0018C3CE4A|nr:hypothetical protein [Planomonospora sp. ID82291]MBG0813416.1 hypothetical protein [Planomonospora sp. ID82291]
MDITHTTVPGTGTVHHFETRDGQRFCVLVDENDRLSLMIYGPDDPDLAVECVVMERDEAAQVAEILQPRPIADRIADLEHRVAALTGGPS